MKLKKFIAIIGLLWGLCLTAYATEPITNLIWIIGDGMGPEIMGFSATAICRDTIPKFPTWKE